MYTNLFSQHSGDILLKIKGEKVLPILSNMKSRLKWSLLVILIVPAIHSQAATIESKRLKVKHDVECYIPYASNLPIDKVDANINHLIIAVYSSGSNIFNSCIELLAKYDRQQDNVIVLSPQFLTKDQVAGNSEKNLLYWNVPPFYGSKISTTNSFDGDLRVSAYHILEDIIADFSDKKIFPNLERITILGHSAGGQLVNRFAASNTIEYIIINPSSYIYFSPKRSVGWSRRTFNIPSDSQISDNPGYNDYSYGLNKLYSYHRRKRLTSEKMRELYPKRKIVYLLGQKDCVPDGSMSTHPSAMIQGRNRLERGKIYFGHLIDEFGPEIKKNQKVIVVKRVGHYGKGMVLSNQGRAFILN